MSLFNFITPDVLLCLALASTFACPFTPAALVEAAHVDG
jgi:hypothetical protein